MPEPAAGRPHMPGYGIKASTEGSGLLPWSWVEQQLTTSHNFWLATRWPDGRPHVMPVWAAWHQRQLLFSSSKQSRKALNLASDPRCVLTTEDSQNPVVVEGVAELLSEVSDLQTYLAATNTKYGTSYGSEMVDPTRNCAYRVRPIWIFGLRAEDFTGTPTRWTFEE